MEHIHANTSTPEQCSDTGFSQSGCGFVLEFVDTLGLHRMNPAYSSGNGTGTKGGWEYSEMRQYVNNDIYNALPSPLKDAIIDTYVVTNHGGIDSVNSTTIDKVFLLSYREVGFSTLSYYTTDTALPYVRVLDYYSTNTKFKYNNGTAFTWWLRSPGIESNLYFVSVSNQSGLLFTFCYDEYNVSPAFRIG